MPQFSKPPPWDIQPHLVDTRYRDLWRGLFVLIPFWRWPDNRVVDVAAHRYATTVGSAPYWESGDYGPELRFDGTDDYLEWSDAAYLRRPSDAITLYALWRYDDQPEAWGDIFSKSYDGGSQGESWAIGYSNFTDTRGRIRTGSGYFTATAATNLSAGDRRHLWVRWASGEVVTHESFYPNGNLFDSGTSASAAGTIAYNTYGMRIAASDADANDEGTYALVAAWDRKLTDGEVALVNRDPFGIIRPQPRRILSLAPAAAADAMPMAMDLYRWRRT
jgi:hypothetical protein